MYDDYEVVVNKDINICFLSGIVSSKPDFNFFYNSKKLISKTEFLLETELGFNGSKIEQSMEIKMFAYNERADFIYKELDIGDKIMVKVYEIDEQGRINLNHKDLEENKDEDSQLD